MGDPAALADTTIPAVATAIPEVIAGETQAQPSLKFQFEMFSLKDGTKAQSANKNGKKSDSGSGSGSFFTWFIVLALLGVWTSVAVVYFDLVDYQGVLGKLVAYDTDGDGDFDVEDAKVLLDEKPDSSRTGLKREPSSAKDVGLKLREALKQQLAIIHERVEAKKLAKLALAEVRELLMKEEEEKELELGRKGITTRVKERVAARLKEEEEKIEKAEMEKALEKLRTEKQLDKKKEEVGQEEDKQTKSGGEEKSEKEVEGKKAKQEDEGRGESAREKKKKSKADKSERGSIKKK